MRKHCQGKLRYLFMFLLAAALACLAAASLAPAAAAADTTPPVITNVSPADGGTVYTSSITISADYSDEPGGSGIDPSTAMIHVDNHMIMSGCTQDSTHISCPKSGLTYGSHKLEVFVSDYAGNEGYSLTHFNVGDNVAPAISNITANASTISANYSDPAPSSGVNTASVAVYVDGGSVPGCTATGSPAGTVSCPAPAPGPGMHTIDVYIADNAGNIGSGSGAWCVGRPNLSLAVPHAYWAGMSDYITGILSVDWTISNAGPNAYSVQITGSTNTNGVTVNSGVPSVAVNIATGGSATVTIKYHIPANVSSWHTDMTGSAQDECGNSYTYP